MDEYVVKEEAGWGVGYAIDGNGNPFINLFQHKGALSDGFIIKSPRSFGVSLKYDTNRIYEINRLHCSK